MAKTTAPNGGGPPPVTSVQDWFAAQDEGIRLTLPESGHVVKVWKNLLDLASDDGSIIDMLSSLFDVLDGLDKQVAELDEDQAAVAYLELAHLIQEVPEMMQFINPVIQAVVVEPKIALPGEAIDGALPIDMLTFTDRMYIWHWASAETKQLEPFRHEPVADVAAVPAE
jgi:hypothetical protein